MHTLSKFEANRTDGSWDIDIFLPYPSPSTSILTIISTWPLSTWDMASDPMPQQLITQSAWATADAIASVLTARTASISLPTYDWNSQDAYHSFSIFSHTLENWLLLNCILPDSEDHLQVCFCSPRHQIPRDACTMDANWQWRGTEGATKAKASTFLDRIQQGMIHDINTHVHLGELEEIVARPGEDPQDLVTCIKTLMDCCEMTNDEHCKHELCCHIMPVHTAMRESS